MVLLLSRNQDRAVYRLRVRTNGVGDDAKRHGGKRDGSQFVEQSPDLYLSLPTGNFRAPAT